MILYSVQYGLTDLKILSRSIQLQGLIIINLSNSTLELFENEFPKISYKRKTDRKQHMKLLLQKGQ